MLASVCAVKCRLSDMPSARKEVVSWGNFCCSENHVIGFLAVKAIGSALQIQLESW